MSAIQQLLTDHIDVWTCADTEKRSGRGRASSNAGSVYGIRKLRELILELAVRGKLVPQDAKDEPASELLKRIQKEKENLIAIGKIKKGKPLQEIINRDVLCELPKVWEWTTLAVISLVNPRNDAKDNLSVSFVSMTMIGTTFASPHDQEPRIWKDIKQGFTHFAEGDIGVAKITPCFENSKACVFSGLINGIGAGTTELHIVRPLASTLVPRYVLAYLKSPQFLLVGETKMTGTAGQKRLPKEFVEYNPFPLPPLAEQHRIVAKVDELMALCDQLEAKHYTAAEAHEKIVNVLLESLTQSADAKAFSENWQRIAAHFDTLFTTEQSIDALKQTLLQLAVMGKLVPQDANDEPVDAVDLPDSRKVRRDVPASVSLNKFASKFDVPKNWKLLSISEMLRSGMIVDLKDGNHGANHPVKSEFTKEGLPFITAAQVSNYSIDYISAYKLSGKPLSKLKVGFAKSGDVIYTHKGSVGRVAIADQDCILSPQTTYYRVDPSAIYNQYLMYYMDSPALKLQVDEVKKQTTRDFVAISKQYEFFYLIPPKREQIRIVNKITELLALCNHLKVQFNQANQLQQKLADVMVERAVA